VLVSLVEAEEGENVVSQLVLVVERESLSACRHDHNRGDVRLPLARFLDNQSPLPDVKDWQVEAHHSIVVQHISK
jgi:hypothetical protein